MRLAAASETPTAATPDSWIDVLTGLTGLRLHALEELLAVGEATGEEIAARVVTWASTHASPRLRAEAGSEGAVENALHWLAHHRLAQRGGSGCWRGRAIPQAMPIFLQRGPDHAHTFTLGGSLGAQEGRADRRSQGQEAHAEAAKGDTFHSPPRPPIHAPQFFDFGDY